MTLRNCAPSIFSHHIYTDYVDDIFGTFLEREQKRLRFNFTSPQLEYRHSLIDFMKNFSEYRSFNKTTLYLGVYFLDMFMDSHQIALERLNLVAIVCLLLAAKLDEKEANIPRFAEVKQITNILYPASDYFNLEVMILHFFEWELLVPTAVNFIELYIEAIITEEDYQYHTSHALDGGNTFRNLSNMKLTAATIIAEFLDLCLCQVGLLQVLPSLLAASIIAATRYVLYLEPVWDTNLIKMTGYQLKQVEDLVSELLHLRREAITPNCEQRRKNTPDSGYISVHEASPSDTELETGTSTKRKRVKFSLS